MSELKIIKDKDNNDYVIITNEDGSEIGMLKTVWDEQQKAAELGGTL